MAPTKLQLVKVRLTALRRTLEEASEKKTSSPISQPMANNFNGMIEEISQEAPDIKDALPKPVTSTTSFAMMGLADINYLDLKILVEQTIAVLQLVESERQP